MLIRATRVSDAPAIARVHIASATDAYAPLAKNWSAPAQAERTKQWAKWLAEPAYVNALAERNGRVVGFARGGPPRESGTGYETELRVVHVLPAERGRGVGSALWSEVCAKMRGLQQRSVYVDTFAELPAVRFYEARGGALVRKNAETYRGGDVHRVRYAWPTGHSHATRRYRLRAATSLDVEFLFQLKQSAYRDHVAITYGAWDEGWQRQRFVDGFDPTDVAIVVRDAEDIGALRIDWRRRPVVFSSIELLPAARGDGLGTEVLGDVLARGRALGVGVELQVFRCNPDAQRLYERLGFAAVGQSETHLRMLWSA